jgi:hypothetical protein
MLEEWLPAADVPGAEVGPTPASRPPPAGTLHVASWNVAFAPDPEAHARADRLAGAHRGRRADRAGDRRAYPGEPSRAERLAVALGITWVYAPERDEGDHTLRAREPQPLPARGRR